MRFIKMQGAGNDYVYVDLFQETLPIPPETLAPYISDRHFGVGGDGLVLICPSDVADARMRMFNADGSESEMCGNAIRCVAKYVAEQRKDRPERLRIATGAGILSLECYYNGDKVERVRVDMGRPVLRPDLVPTNLRSSDRVDCVTDLPTSALKIDFTEAARKDPDAAVVFEKALLSCVSMGNPHCVIFVDKIDDTLVWEYGKRIESSLENFPNKVNVEFIERVSYDKLRMRVWERGSGETLACGTGACASVVAAILSGRIGRKAVVELLGGNLEIEWDKVSEHVFMTGPATHVFSGELSTEFWERVNDSLR